jgi:hypothetical protein
LRVSTSAGDSEKRGIVRFEVERRPTAAEWANYRAGTLAWDAISWPQGIYGSQTGLSQTWVRMELQMVPFASSRIVTPSESVLPLFGSGAVYYELHQ